MSSAFFVIGGTKMTCDIRYQKSALNAYTRAAQTVNAQSVVVFNNNAPFTGCSISHAAGGGTISLNKPGIYLVEFNADASTVATAGGSISMQLTNNGVLVPSAEATATTTVNTAVVNLKFATIVQVLNSCNCVNNDVDLTIINNGVQANLTNANIVVVKLA